MDYEQDYVMRLIKQMMQVLAKLIFHKKEETEKETHARIERGAWGGGLREYGSIFTDQFHTGDCAAHDAP